MAEVNNAEADTLYQWSASLMKPQTEEEQAVLRRIQRRCWDNTQAAMPELVDKMNLLVELYFAVYGEDVREL